MDEGGFLDGVGALGETSLREPSATRAPISSLGLSRSPIVIQGQDCCRNRPGRSSATSSMPTTDAAMSSAVSVGVVAPAEPSPQMEAIVPRARTPGWAIRDRGGPIVKGAHSHAQRWGRSPADKLR